MRYQWINTLARPYGDASEIAQHLEHLRSQADLTIDRILEDAQDAKSPLHNRLEWSDTKAAQRYRRVQVSAILSHLVRVDDKGRPVRMYLSVKGTDDTPRHYDLVTRVMRSPKLRRPYARRALLELSNWSARYGDVPELKAALAQVEQIMKRVVTPALASLSEDR